MNGQHADLRRPLAVGEQTPPIEADAYVRGNEQSVRVRLRDYRGGWVVLFFYPADFTFVCPTEIQEFAALEADFAAEDAVVLGASTDSFWSHKAWYTSDPRLREVAFPVLADPSHAISEALGVLQTDGTTTRTTYIIDPEGAVRYASTTDGSVGRSVQETLRVLQATRTGALCPVQWRPGQKTLSAVPA